MEIRECKNCGRRYDVSKGERRAESAAIIISLVTSHSATPRRYCSKSCSIQANSSFILFLGIIMFVLALFPLFTLLNEYTLWVERTWPNYFWDSTTQSYLMYSIGMVLLGGALTYFGIWGRREKKKQKKLRAFREKLQH